MSNFELRLENPWLLLLVLPAVLIVLLSWLRLSKPGRNSLLHVVPLGLRIAAIALVVLILSGLTFVTDHAETAMLLLVDHSDSTLAAREQMDADLSAILAQAPDDMRLAVMPFAADATLAQDFTRAGELPEWTPPENGASTALGSALLDAAARFPENTLKRVAVLTDGLPTDGHALNAAAELSAKGIRMDALLYDTAILTPEAEVTALQLPSDAALGQPLTATVLVVSSADMSATIRIYDETTQLSERDVQLVSGENAFSFKLSPNVAGMRAYCAELVPAEDTLAQNNRVHQPVFVTSTNAVLIIDGTGEESAALTELLIQNDYEVTTVSSADAPKNINDLCAYGLIIMMNVNTRDLPRSFADRLEQYVSVYGRSVLTTGGSNTYIYGGMKDTALETLLPIAMEVEERESAESIALLLLIDNSASMEGTAITMAKRGAIKSIESLNDNDYVGVITFSTEHSVLTPITSMAEKDDVVRAISGLGTVMGTMYTGALEEARDQLAAFDAADRKHVILLSDGNPSDVGYETYIREMRNDGVTVSTIALGRDVSEALMAELADLGGGECHIVTSSYDLPDIMMTDTILLQVDYECEGTVNPRLAAGAFYGQKAPKIEGYIRVQPKAEADVLITVEKDRPLYVRWAYGAGLAASLTTDLGARWSKAWLDSAEGRSLILSMIADMLPGAHAATATSVSMQAGGSRGMLTVTSADAQPGYTFSAEITTPSGAQFAVPLNVTGEGIHQREIELDSEGKYLVTLHEYDANRQKASTQESAFTVSWSTEYEAFPTTDVELEMRQVCAVASGTVVHSPQELLSVQTDDMLTQYDPSHAFAAIASMLILLDILIRRIKPRFLARLHFPPYKIG